MPKIKLHDLLNIKSEDYVKIRIKLNQHQERSLRAWDLLLLY